MKRKRTSDTNDTTSKIYLELPKITRVSFQEAIQRHEQAIKICSNPLLHAGNNSLDLVKSKQIQMSNGETTIDSSGSGQLLPPVVSVIRCVNRQGRMNKEKFRQVVKREKRRSEALTDPLAYHYDYVEQLKGKEEELNAYFLNVYPILQKCILSSSAGQQAGNNNSRSLRVCYDGHLSTKYFQAIGKDYSASKKDPSTYDDGVSSMPECMSCGGLDFEKSAVCCRCGVTREVYTSSFSDRINTHRKKQATNNKKKIFTSILNQLQGDFPSTLNERVAQELISILQDKYDFKPPICADVVQEALRDHSLNEQYSYIIKVTTMFNNHEPKKFDPSILRSMSDMYDKITPQVPLLRAKYGLKGSSRINNEWLVRRMLLHLGLKAYLPYITHLKDEDSAMANEFMWNKVFGL